MSNEVRRWSAPTEKVEYDPHACVDRVSWADVVLADDYEALKARLAEAEKLIQLCDIKPNSPTFKAARAYLDKWGRK